MSNTLLLKHISSVVILVCYIKENVKSIHNQANTELPTPDFMNDNSFK